MFLFILLISSVAKKLKLSKANGGISKVRSTHKLKSSLRNGDAAGSSSSLTELLVTSTGSYDTMALDERKALLMQTCGVVSEHTRKMCTK